MRSPASAWERDKVTERSFLRPILEQPASPLWFYQLDVRHE
jgi:hypothetical protein